MQIVKPIRPAHALPPLVGVALLWIGVDGGSYSLLSRSSLGLVAWWTIALGVALALWPRARAPAAALGAGALLAGLAALTGLSALWAAGNEAAFAEFERVTLYLGVYALVVVAAGRGTARLWIAGLAAGATAVALTGLAGYLFPAAFDTQTELARLVPLAARRLAYPLDYWNGLATLVAVTLPLLLFLVTSARSPLGRGLALAPVPALAAALYLTSSRGGFVAAALALLAFLLLGGRGWASCGAALVAAPATAVAVAVVREGGTGWSEALVLLAACLLTGGLWALAARLMVEAPALGPLAQGAVIATGLLAAVVGVLALDPGRRLEAFKEPPVRFGTATLDQHLFSAGGNGRWQLWQSALDAWQTRPALGRGAGSFEAWWAEHGSIAVFVRDAHSLYLETLAELGVAGLVLLVGVFAVGFGAAATRLRDRHPAERAAVAALAAGLLAYLFEAGIDWMWELTAVSVLAFACLGLLTGPATLAAAPGSAGPAALPRWLGAAVTLVALALAAGQAIPLITQHELELSRAAVDRGDAGAALEHAGNARTWQPWAASPHLQLALVRERTGDIPGALASIEDALARDAVDWRLWLIAARIQTKAGAFEEAEQSLERAAGLNPRSPLFRELDLP